MRGKLKRLVRRLRPFGTGEDPVERSPEEKRTAVESVADRRTPRTHLQHIIEAKGRARRAGLVYAAGLAVFAGQQPYRVRANRNGDFSEQLIRISLSLDALMIALLVWGGLTGATALWAASYLVPAPASEGKDKGRKLIRWLRRSWRAVRTHLRGVALRLLALILALLVLGAGVVDIIEDAILLSRLDPDLSIGLSPTVRILGLLSVLLGLLASGTAWLLQKAARTRIMPGAPRTPLVSGGSPDLVVACSGGGLRSASFALGALQVLQAKGDLTKDTPVFAVSGGSYIASAIASLRDGGIASVLEPDSAAERRLRNNTRYLVPTAKEMFWGAVCLLWGVVVNLLFAAMVLRIIAVLTAGFLRETGVLESMRTWRPAANFPAFSFKGDLLRFQQVDQWFVQLWLLPIVAGLLLIIITFGLDRYVKPGDYQGVLRSIARSSLVVGFIMLSLFVLLPTTAAGLARAAQENRPNATLARAISGLGLTTPDGCRAALRHSFVEAAQEAQRAGKEQSFGACGITSTAFAKDLRTGERDACRADEAPDCAALNRRVKRIAGVDNYVSNNRLPGQAATLAALIAGVAGLARTAAGVLGQPKDPQPPLTSRRFGRFLRKARVGLRTRLRQTFAPWLGTLLVVLLALFLQLRWLRDLAVIPRGTAFSPLQVGVPVLVLIVLAGVTNANRTSLHTFYRERLSVAFATVQDSAGVVRPRPYREPWKLSDLASPLTICAAVSCSEPGVVPPGRECTSFTFTSSQVGMTDPWLPAFSWRSADTRSYEKFSERIVTVPASVAISGAAVSPVTGRQARSRPLRLLLAMANVRLGVWLRNPALLTDSRTQRQAARGADSPGVWWVFREAFGRTSLEDSWLYVTDGGHYENLGMVEALRGRPQRLVVLDAGADGENTFSALGTAIATARMDLGVEIEVVEPYLPFSDEAASGAPHSAFSMIATHPGGATTTIYYGKLVLTDKLPWDAQSYALQHPEYPQLSTGQQLYGEFDFEAYRVLGREVGCRLATMLSRP